MDIILENVGNCLYIFLLQNFCSFFKKNISIHVKHNFC
jgi:hypothetical protein